MIGRLFVVALFLLPVGVIASDYERTPAGAEILSPVSFSIFTTLLEQQQFNNLNILSNPYVCLILSNADQNADWQTPENLPYYTTTWGAWNTNENTLNGNFIANIPAGVTVAEIQLNSYQTQSYGCDTQGVAGETFYDTFTIIPEAIYPVWGSPNGFWGETTPAMIIGDMTASVQDTGDNVWPLLAFVGIPLGFAIAGLLIYQINKTLTPVDTGVKVTREDNKDNFVYHSASDLEFKRNYGKRKNREPIV